jgi:hypothetical protein
VRTILAGKGVRSDDLGQAYRYGLQIGTFCAKVVAAFQGSPQPTTRLSVPEIRHFVDALPKGLQVRVRAVFDGEIEITALAPTVKDLAAVWDAIVRERDTIRKGAWKAPRTKAKRTGGPTSRTEGHAAGSPGHTLQAGDNLLGDYCIERLLGEGAFGRVYLARELVLERSVAIKDLRDALHGQPDAVRRHIQEAQTLARLSHPNVVTIHAFRPPKTPRYIVMEYLPETLARRLDDQHRLEPGEAVRIITDVLGGLERVHDEGIIHRDIKPDNVLLTANGTAKLGDFGIAHVPCVSGESSLTLTGSQPRTPLYMSPEQARGEEVDGRSDLYSVGALLYRMLTGEHYFRDAETWGQIYDAVLHLVPITPSQLNASIPQALDGIVMRLLAKDRNSRFATAADVIRALEQVPLPKITADNHVKENEGRVETGRIDER